MTLRMPEKNITLGNAFPQEQCIPEKKTLNGMGCIYVHT